MYVRKSELSKLLRDLGFSHRGGSFKPLWIIQVEVCL